MTRSRRGRGGHGGGGGGGGHGGGDSRWLVTYADLLTLLMVLFLVLWVISTIDLKKFEKFKEGLGDFGNPAAVADAKGETEESLPTESTDGDHIDTTTTAIPTTTVLGPDGSVLPMDGQQGTDLGGEGSGTGGVLGASELGDLVGGLQDQIDSAGLGGVVSIDVQQRGVVISVSTDNVLFESGSAVLGPEAAQVIGTIAPDLAGIGNRLIIEGYTDRRPLRKQGYDNWDLSVDRAVTVLKYLRANFDIDSERLAATGYGDQYPVDAGDSEEAYAKNRRVEIVIIAGPDDETSDAPVTGTT